MSNIFNITEFGSEVLYTYVADGAHLITPLNRVGTNFGLSASNMPEISPQSVAGVLRCLEIYIDFLLPVMCKVGILACSVLAANSYSLYQRSEEFRATVLQSYRVFPELLKFISDIPTQIAVARDFLQR